MTFIKNQAVDPNTAQAADTPQPPPSKLTPEAVVEQLRAVRQQLEAELSLSPLTKEQRRTASQRARRQTNAILQSSINIIGSVDTVSQAVGLPAADIRQMCDDANRWTAAADELRVLLNGIEGANTIRAQRLADIAKRAYAIGTQMSLDPANAALVPHVEEIKRLKKLGRRKKSAPQTPEPPTPQTAETTPDHPKV
ncbi:MAG TPA: hypothetical protein VH087_04865 [Thermoanaerobaculia bacterium]|nr:hypothetical protein [Thermoanaerobaculia bacterium]